MATILTKTTEKNNYGTVEPMRTDLRIDEPGRKVEQLDYLASGTPHTHMGALCWRTVAGIQPDASIGDLIAGLVAKGWAVVA